MIFTVNVIRRVRPSDRGYDGQAEYPFASKSHALRGSHTDFYRDNAVSTNHHSRGAYASSNKCTKYASAASCNAKSASLCQRKPAVSTAENSYVTKSCATSRTLHEMIITILLNEETNKSGKRQLSQQQSGALLIHSDLPQCHRAGPVTTGLACNFLLRVWRVSARPQKWSGTVGPLDGLSGKRFGRCLFSHGQLLGRA